MFFNKKLILIFSFLILSVQTFFGQVSISIGGNEGDEAVDLSVFQDRIFIAGTFQNMLGTDPSYGGSDVFLQSYNLNGLMLWQYVIGSGNNDQIKSICSSPYGTLYTAGTFSDSLFFNNNDTVLYSHNQAVFITKHHSDGELIWAKCFQNQSLTVINDLECDSSGNIYITGAFQDSFVVDNATTLYGNSKNDIYLIKLDSNASVKWAVNSVLSEEAEGMALALDSLGNIYFSGHFKGYFSLMSDSFQAHPIYPDIFLSALDSGGNFLWQKHLGGAYDNNCKVLKWADGSLYLGGSFKGSLNIDTISLATAFRDWDAFVARFNMDGSAIWATQTVTLSDCILEDIDISGNKLIICGSFYERLIWQNQQLQAIDNADGFQVLMNTDAEQLQMINWGGSGYELPMATAFHYSGKIVTDGGFQQNMDFSDTSLNASGFSDAFLTIQLPLLLHNDVLFVDQQAFNFQAFPNPANQFVHIYTPDADIQKWILLNSNAQIIRQGTFSEVMLKELPSGTYFLYVLTDKGSGIKKIQKY